MLLCHTTIDRPRWKVISLPPLYNPITVGMLKAACFLPKHASFFLLGRAKCGCFCGGIVALVSIILLASSFAVLDVNEAGKWPMWIEHFFFF